MGERSTLQLPARKPSSREQLEPDNGTQEWWDRQDAARAARTKAEDEPFYSPSLAMSIAERLGPGFQHGYRPDRKHFIQTPYDVNVQGLYALQQPEKPLSYPYAENQAGETLSDVFTPKRDHLYEFGTKPSSQVLAHEYRHRAGVTDEMTNRLYDAMYARTPEDWQNAVHMWQDFLVADGNGPTSTEEAEQNLMMNLKKQKMEMLGKEYDSAPEGDKPVAFEEPSLGGFLVDLLHGQRGNYMQQNELPYQKIPNTGPNKPEPLPPAERRGYPRRTNR